MTCREMYDYALIELNKVEAPSLLLEDFNYFMNKAVQQYINKVYNRYDINQQSSDDLRVLKEIAKIMLKEYAKSLNERGIELKYNDATVKWLAQSSKNHKSGARKLRNLIRKEVEDNLTNELLEKDIDSITTVTLSLDESNLKKKILVSTN